MQDGKALVRSKELWFNIVMFIIELATYAESTVPTKYLPYVVAVHTIGNIILRTFFTSQPIKSVF